MNGPVETRQLRSFIVLAEELHFSAAAERLRVAQPAFSQQIKRLERQVGARLFERTTRSVRLTKAGEMFLLKARFALNQIDDAVDLARKVARGAEDRLTVGFIQPALYQGLPEAIREFSARYRDVELRLEHLSSPEQVTALSEGRLDLGIVRPPVATTGLAMTTIAREGFAAALPRFHPAAHLNPFRLSDLASEPLVNFRSSTGDVFPQMVAPFCRQAGFEPNFVVETTTTATTLGLVAAGLAIAVVPGWVRNIAPAGIVFRHLAEIPPLVELSATWSPAGRSAALQPFLSILRSKVVNCAP